MVYEFTFFVNITTFLSYLIVSLLVLMMSKKFLEKLSLPWYVLSCGIILIGLDNLLMLLSLIGYVGNVIALFGSITDFFGSILILVGFTLVLFQLASTYELRRLEGRRKDIDFLLSSVESKADDGLSKEVINNLRKELIDIEKKIEELK